MSFLASSQMTGTNIGNAQNYSSSWVEENNEIRLTSCGNGFKKELDNLFFVYKKTAKDLILSGEPIWLSGSGSLIQRAGIMLRENLSPNSRFVALAKDGENRILLIIRTLCDSSVIEKYIDTLSRPVFWLEKEQSKIIIKLAPYGEPLQEIEIIDFASDTLYYGAYIFSGNRVEEVTASFINFRSYIKAPNNFVPYRDYIGSQLEVLDITTGKREIIYKTTEPIEAPNWTPDGQAFIFNSRGLLFRLDKGKTKPIQIPTHFATSNNNDHGISPDGKWIAISHHDPNLPQGENSLIYILPLEGGIPRKITNLAPSYWHGWSPDGKWLVYTAKRDKKWNIFKISVDGGEEVQLTNNEYLNDGPEFSPDGKYIWFNSNRSGRMQIWKMQPDGTEQEQVTYDEYQNWFPHFSPNGKHVIYLSYLPQVDSWEHPYYKEVMLHVMSLEGKDKHVVAYLYGGQGTINVPSWSPDGKKVAFVSNTDNE
ncbi:MAG: SMP-30/gluconolactonase/LRE family protein [Bacteroidales bacterium]|nr:SMP-30/gluconolactonase/LRE family protein [Bacteroidales bacterium]